MTIDPATAYLYGTMLQRRGMFDATATTGSRDIPAPALHGRKPVIAGEVANRSAAALSRILAGSVYPLRFEPHNPVGIHRGVASSSGAYPVDLIVSDPARGNGFLVDSPNFCLSPISWCAPPDPDPDAAPWLYLVARLDRLIARYGDLAFGLAAYEAGMIAGQVRLLAREEGWEFQYHPLHGDQHLRAATGEYAWQWVPLIAGRLVGATARAAIPAVGNDARYRRLLQQEDDDAVRAPMTHALLAQSRAPHIHAAIDPAPQGSLQWFDLHQAITARTSDAQRQHSALMPHYSVQECDILLKRTTTLLAAMQPCAACQQRAGLLVIADGSNGPFGGQLALSCGQSWTPLEPDSLNASYRLLQSDGGGGFACYIVVDEAEHPITDCSALVNEWLWTGVVTQALCLAASSLGWFSRPVRNFDDARANALVSLHERVVMKVELGKLAAPPFSFALEQA
jgi:hypothetical protein